MDIGAVIGSFLFGVLGFVVYKSVMFLFFDEAIRRRKIKKIHARYKKHKLTFQDLECLSYLLFEEIEYLKIKKAHVPLESKKFLLIEKKITSCRKKYNDINERIKRLTSSSNY